MKKLSKLENYEVLQSGVVRQITRTPFDYDINYASERYAKTPYTLSYARLGYLISKISRLPSSVLDVGYGTGQFLEVVHSVGIPCFGFDISPTPTPPGILKVSSILENHYDVITFFDSLEHFEDITFIKKLDCNYIVVSVPSCNHPDNPEWFFNWKHLRPDEHLWHFSPKALTAFMEESGYSEISQEVVEDAIRKDDRYTPNIITGIYRKNENL
jgi:SAM-dependent methyltransferase